MKRRAVRHTIRSVAVVVLVVGFFGPSITANEEDACQVRHEFEASPPEVAALHTPWTVLFYSNADGNVVNVSDEFAELMQSTEAAHVLMLEDPADDGATLWHVGGSSEAPLLTCLESWGEVDMADDATLRRFVEFAHNWYPSERTVVMLYSHGRGWRGACYDDTPAPEGEDAEWSWLTPQEMQDVFSSVGGLDALFFTSPCITGAAELVYELRNSVDLVIAAEPMSSFSVWHGGLGLLNDLLVAEPEISLDDLAVRLLDEIEPTYDRQAIIDEYDIPFRNQHLIPYVGLTAVTRGEGLDGLTGAIDAFAQGLLDRLDESFSSIEWRRSRAQDFGNYEVVDAYDFAEKCSHIEGLGAVARDLMAAIDEAVLAFIKDPDGHPDAHGLSLYFPMPGTGAAIPFASFHEQYGFGAHGTEYRTQGLDLVRETHWDEFLMAFYDRMLAE